MSINNPFVQKLEMNCILKELIDFAIIPNTKNKFTQLIPSNDISYLNSCLDEVDEALQLIYRYDRAPIMIASDYNVILDYVSKGAMLSGIELFETIRLYDTIKANDKMMNSLIKEQQLAPYYLNHIQQLFVNPYLDQELTKSVDELGNILDSASSELKRIRANIRNVDARIKSKLQEIVSKEGSKLSQNVVAMRDDHYVVPVKSEYKNSFAGLVRDVSSSQQTIFIEPSAIVELTNHKASLINDEHQEIKRILRSLSTQIANESEILRTNFKIICELDFVFAKAMLAKKEEAVRPLINNEHRFNLISARHPLLNVPKIIPNNVSFGKGYLGIIITGPNTGGKTVLLKTVGLLSLMLKYGLLIPCDPKSDLMIFDQICCDIGDDQSIHENLSTFSSHMSNIIAITNVVTPNSLVLFDEIGAGTDPDEGSNLAIAILSYLINMKVSFLATTHYSLLKAFAFETPSVINASMKFDQDTLSPTYMLELGLPGASNAFNIAKRLGLRSDIIDDAINRTVSSANDVRMLITKLENRGIELNNAYQEVETLKKSYQEKNDQLDKRINNINNEKRLMIQKAQKEAEKIIQETNAKAFKILDDIQKLGSKDIKLHEIIAAKKAISDLEVREETPLEIKEEFNVGDDVYVPSYDQYGVITKQLKTGLFEVAIGNIKMKIEPTGLKKVKKVPIKKESSQNFVQVKSVAHISLTLDLRGKRYEEAKDLLEKYFDDIMVSNIKQCTIIHGYGTGTIRELVHQFIKNNPNIESSRNGVQGEGGFGVTVINLK